MFNDYLNATTCQVAHIESGWNCFDAIPGIGIVTGLTRIPVGFLQMTLLGGAVFLGNNIAKIGCPSEFRERNLKPIDQFAKDHAINGTLNMLKGPINAMMATNLTGFGVFLLAAALHSKNTPGHILPVGSWSWYTLQE